MKPHAARSTRASQPRRKTGGPGWRSGSIQNVALLIVAFFVLQTTVGLVIGVSNVTKQFFRNDTNPRPMHYRVGIEGTRLPLTTDIGNGRYAREDVEEFYEAPRYFIFKFSDGSYLAIPKDAVPGQLRSEVIVLGDRG